jgi:hypothetical protein
MLALGHAQNSRNSAPHHPNPAEAQWRWRGERSEPIRLSVLTTMHALFTRKVECKMAAAEILAETAKSVSRSSHANGLRPRTCAYFRRSCHGIPIG